MLSWSGKEASVEVDLDAIATGNGDGGLPHGNLLVEYASAIASFDDGALNAARQRLLNAAGVAVMVDAAAVAANFEMMTRVANGTGATFEGTTLAKRDALGHRLGVTRPQEPGRQEPGRQEP